MLVKDIIDYIDDNDYYIVELKFADGFGSFIKHLVFIKGHEESKDEFEFYNIDLLHVSRIEAYDMGAGNVCVLIRVQETVKTTIE